MKTKIKYVTIMILFILNVPMAWGESQDLPIYEKALKSCQSFWGEDLENQIADSSGGMRSIKFGITYSSTPFGDELEAETQKAFLKSDPFHLHRFFASEFERALRDCEASVAETEGPQKARVHVAEFYRSLVQSQIRGGVGAAGVMILSYAVFAKATALMKATPLIQKVILRTLGAFLVVNTSYDITTIYCAYKTDHFNPDGLTNILDEKELLEGAINDKKASLQKVQRLIQSSKGRPDEAKWIAREAKIQKDIGEIQLTLQKLKSDSGFNICPSILSLRTAESE